MQAHDGASTAGSFDATGNRFEQAAARRETMRELRAQGLSMRQIAKIMGMTPGSVHYAVHYDEARRRIDSQPPPERDGRGSRIRKWAIEQGLPVAVRGQIAKEVRDAYAVAHPEDV